VGRVEIAADIQCIVQNTRIIKTVRKNLLAVGDLAVRRRLLHGLRPSTPDLLTTEAINRTTNVLLYAVEDIGQEDEGGLDIAKEDYHKEVDHCIGYPRRRIDNVDIYALKVFKRLPRFGSRYIDKHNTVHPIYTVVVRAAATLPLVPVLEVEKVKLNVENDLPK